MATSWAASMPRLKSSRDVHGVARPRDPGLPSRRMLDPAEELIEVLRSKTPEDVADLMSISDDSRT